MLAISSSGLTNIPSLASQMGSLDRKNLIQKVISSPSRNPFDRVQQLESKQAQQFMEEKLANQKAVLQPIIERYLNDLKNQQASKLLTAKVAIASE